jgi:hypothetical protein
MTTPVMVPPAATTMPPSPDALPHGAPTGPPAPGIPLRVIPPLISTALIMVGAGVIASLLPLRFSAMGLSPGVIGLIATAEALGFLVGCLHAHRIIAPVGLERAYGAFAGMKAVAILSLYFAESVPVIALFRFIIGLNAAGLAIIVESWLNALVPNEQRGRVLTIYVLVYGLFYGAGQLIGQNMNVSGPEFLIIAGISTTLALIPMVGIDVRAPDTAAQDQARDPEGAAHLAGERARLSAERFDPHRLFHRGASVRRSSIGFDQQHIVLLMACVSLGGLFLQWPIGYFSDKVDRLYALIGLGASVLAVGAALDDGRPAHSLRAARGTVCNLRRTGRKSLRGRRRARQRPCRRGRLRRVLLDVAIRLGPRRRDRPDHRHLCHSAHIAAAHSSFTSSRSPSPSRCSRVWRLYRRKLDRVVEGTRIFSLTRRHPRNLRLVALSSRDAG